MTRAEILPILSSGSPSIYRLCVFLSLVGSSVLISRDSKNWPLHWRHRWTVILACLYGGFLGCMIPTLFAKGGIREFWLEAGAETSIRWDYFYHSLLGPKTVIGGLLGGFLLVASVKRIFKINYDTSDGFARGTAWMLVAGRFGCVAQHCCFGRDFPVGVDYGDGHVRFPVQALEAGLCTLLLIFVHRLHVRDEQIGKRLFWVFTGYGTIRFFCEFLRAPVAEPLGPVGYYQMWALILAALGFFQCWKRSQADASQVTIS
jgi:hypothetical protein